MIIFRADGNSYVGYGHVMRCLSIADAFHRRGEQCLFVLAGEEMKERIEKRGHSVHVLGGSHERLNEEIASLCKVLHGTNAKLLIVDSYYVTDFYFEALRKTGINVAYVDDLQEHAFPVDFLVNYNVYADLTKYETIYSKAQLPFPKAFLGPKYVPLREEYQNVSIERSFDRVKNVFVSTGGTDPIGLAKNLLQYLQAKRYDLLQRENIRFHFLIGAGNPDYAEIAKCAENLSCFQIHYNLPEIKSLLKICDLAISAAGSTLYEICALGVPCITYALADNQLQGCDAFDRLGLMISLGDVRNDKKVASKIWEVFESLSKDAAKREEISLKMQGLIDGHGADRIAEQLLFY